MTEGSARTPPTACLVQGLRDLEHSPFVFAVVLAVTSVAAALVALLIMSTWPRKRAVSEPNLHPAAEDRAVFLFDDRDLVDASAAGRRLLAVAPARGDAWTQLVSSLAPMFPGFEGRMATLAQRGCLSMQAEGDRHLGLMAEWRGGLARITLTDDEAEVSGLTVDRLSYRAMQDEIAGLRATMDEAPVLMWRQDAAGAVVQANRAYLMLAAARSSEEMTTWPLPVLFDIPAAAEADGRSWRARIDLPDAPRPRWFDCHSYTLENERLHFAQPVDGLVQAEASLRDFVQTLSKTFAHLPIGLAVFDRARRLQLFNPSLTDLTTLSPDFLIGRPTLAAFLDRLRERHILPEPKDYRSWRQRITDLEEAAAQGHYQETWELPGGQTYRVSGRPHPEGAIAFLFEDISAEVTMTRRFRAEIALGQSVMDALDEAMVVFSDRGTVIAANAAYDALWPEARPRGATARSAGEALQIWREGCRQGPQWEQTAARLREALLPMQGVDRPPRQAWVAQLCLQGGRDVTLRLSPLPGGATLVVFRPSPDEQADAGKKARDTEPAPLSPVAAPEHRRVN
jgi:PAS domain-containing protein